MEWKWVHRGTGGADVWEETWWAEKGYISLNGALYIITCPEKSGFFLRRSPLDRTDNVAGPFETLEAAKAAYLLMV